MKFGVCIGVVGVKSSMLGLADATFGLFLRATLRDAFSGDLRASEAAVPSGQLR